MRVLRVPVETATPASYPTATLYVFTAEAGFCVANAPVPTAVDLLPNTFAPNEFNPTATL